MSRIGKKPVSLPKGVSIGLPAGKVIVKGPKGELTQAVVPMTSVTVDGAVAVVARDSDSPGARSNHGLMRALLNNMIVGVTVGFERRLEVVGVGFKAEAKGRSLLLNLGYSHPVEYALPAGVDASVDKQTTIVLRGSDKQIVSQAAAEIRGFRKPDHYKGKGVRYLSEQVRIKAGKSA